ncbi:MAG: rhodanese-like domain-containing protein [bacterium]
MSQKFNNTTTETKTDTIKQISTREMLQAIENSEIKIIDVRSVNAYNGWKEQNEMRGGHIKGAKSLPAMWAEYIDWIEIVRSKKISPRDSLIIYGYDNPQTAKVAELFLRSGYEKVSVYHNFVDEWSSHEEYPMQHLKRYRHLISAGWLRELLTHGTAPEYENKKIILCHAHYHNKEDYEKGHIPGAVAVDTNSLESTETWNRRSPQELKQTLESLGITHNTTVILYGRFSDPDIEDPFPGSSSGHLAAFRCAFIMMYAGVKDIRILNGGLQSWKDAGFETTGEVTVKEPSAEFGAEIPVHPEIVVDLEEAEKILKAENKNLVCMRSWKEYIGEVSGYNYIEKKGRIPGAVFADCGSDPYHLQNYRNLDHTTREYHEIEENWAAANITPDKFNAFYCGTGWRGSEAFFNAWFMGWPSIALFDGGWFEWSNHNYPFETGVPK